MTIFVRGDVVRVPFPGIRPAEGKENEPVQTALVVSPSDLERRLGLLWVTLVASPAEPDPDADLPILDHAVAGVAPGSVVRTTWLATVPAQSATRIGRISGPLLGRALGRITGALGRL